MSGAPGSQGRAISSRGHAESDEFLCFSSIVYWGYHSWQVLASRWAQFPFCTARAMAARHLHSCWSRTPARGGRRRAWAQTQPQSPLSTLLLCFLSVLAPRELPFFQASSAMCIKRFVSRFTHRFYSKTVFHHVETAACPFQDVLVTFYGLTWSLSPVSYLWRLLWIGEISMCKDTAEGHLFSPKSSWKFLRLCLRAFSGCGGELVLYTVKPDELGRQPRDPPWHTEVARRTGLQPPTVVTRIGLLVFPDSLLHSLPVLPRIISRLHLIPCVTGHFSGNTIT